MKKCDICSGVSPLNAEFCIECGSKFQGYTFETKRLTPQPNAIHYTDKTIKLLTSGTPSNIPTYVEYYDSVKPYNSPFINGPFFIKRKDFYDLLLKDTNISFMRIIDQNEAKYFYKGREIIFID